MIASLLLTTFLTASPPPTVGLATMPRRDGAAPASTLIRVNAALQQQLERAGVQVKPLGAAHRRALQSCSLSASCVAQVGKGAGVEVVVRANVTVFADNVALVLTAVSTRRQAIVAEDGFGVSPAHVEEELKERAARFVSSAASAAGASGTPPVAATPPPPPPPPPLPGEAAPAVTAPPAVASSPPAAPPSTVTRPNEVDLKSEPQPELLPPPPAEPMVHGEARPSWARTTGWTFTVGAGALAIASAVFIGLGLDAKSTYDGSLTQVGGVTASRLTFDQAHALASKSNFDLTLGVSLLAVAVAFAGAALIFFLTG